MPEDEKMFYAFLVDYIKAAAAQPCLQIFIIIFLDVTIIIEEEDFNSRRRGYRNIDPILVSKNRIG